MAAQEGRSNSRTKAKYKASRLASQVRTAKPSADRVAEERNSNRKGAVAAKVTFSAPPQNLPDSFIGSTSNFPRNERTKPQMMFTCLPPEGETWLQKH